MDGERLAALIEQSQSEHWADRCQAGVLLAACVENEATHATLQRLLHDSANTAVPADTALALLRRQDAHGLRVFALGFASDASDAHDELVALLFNNEDCDWLVLRPLLDSLTYDDARVRDAAYDVLNAMTGDSR